MTAYIFQQIAQKGKFEGIDSAIRQRDARTWFRNAAQEVSSVNTRRLMNDKKNLTNRMTEESIGSMYMFSYNPKHKETLPHYDIFPLIFPIGMKNDGFLGINLHYLPPVLRAILMNHLYETINNKKYDSTTKLKISYELLNGYAKFNYFKPCVKHYLLDYVSGSFLYVEPSNWDIALMLPTERFKKQSKELVWKSVRENLK